MKNKEKKLVYWFNYHIVCCRCHKPRYYGYTRLRDSEMCSHGDEVKVYDKNKMPIIIEPSSNYDRYE